VYAIGDMQFHMTVVVGNTDGVKGVELFITTRVAYHEEWLTKIRVPAIK
jgi:hypothetical protein